MNLKLIHSRVSQMNDFRVTSFPQVTQNQWLQMVDGTGVVGVVVGIGMVEVVVMGWSRVFLVSSVVETGES